MSKAADSSRRSLLKLVRDPVAFAGRNLRIIDKEGSCRPLVFNPQQLALHQEIERQKKAGLPVRIIILKARQLGFSTAIAALFYQQVITRPHVNAMIVAHDKDASNAIFDKIRLFYDRSHPLLAPLRRASNARELVFANPSTDMGERRRQPGLNSRIQIETAVNSEAGRSKTIQLLHLSELAFWPHPLETLTSLKQAVPNKPSTMIIIESTANGVGGLFYEEWRRACQGESAFAPLFFPWQDNEEYSLAAPDFQPDAAEQELAARWDLNSGQLAWRRWCIANNCGGSAELFHQEYPLHPEEAFISSGRPVFDARRLEQALAAASPPQLRGDLVLSEQERVVFRPGERGFLRVWQEPQAGVDYVIGVDVALGVPGGDYSCMQVLRRDTRQQAAEWHGHLAPGKLGREAVFLGRWYNLALLIPEANNHGLATLDEIQRWRYPRLYRRRQENRLNQRRGEEFGFLTTAASKPKLVGDLARLITRDPCAIKSKEAISECLSYVADGQEQTNAAPGCHDDRVMALALACHAASEQDRAEPAADFLEVEAANLYQADPLTGY